MRVKFVVSRETCPLLKNRICGDAKEGKRPFEKIGSFLRYLFPVFGEKGVFFEENS